MRAFQLSLLLLLVAVDGTGQGDLYRRFDQAPLPQNQKYLVCDMRTPVQTADKGYIFSFNPWTANTNGPFPVDDYIIKTDSNKRACDLLQLKRWFPAVRELAWAKWNGHQHSV